MISRITLALASAAILFLTLGIAPHAPNGKSNLIVTLRVTSEDPNEVLSFDAAYLLGGTKGKAQFGKYRTPYELSVSVENDFVAGMFNKTSGGASISVEIELDRNGTKLNSIAGSGSTVVLSTHRGMPGAPDNYAVNTF